MLKNLKIGVRLGCAFGIIMVLLIIQGGLSLFEIKSLNGEMENIVHTDIPKLAQSNDIMDNLNVMARALRNIVIDDNKEVQDKELKRIADSRKIIDDMMEKLKASVKSAEGIEKLNKINEARPIFIKHTDDYIELVKTSQVDQAKGMLLKEVRDSQRACMDAVENLIKFESDEIAEDGEKALADSAQAKMIIVSLLIIALILGVILAIVITLSITRPVNACVEAAKKIAVGDTDVQLDSTSKDETGILQVAMQKMIGAINA
ncbi:MAG: MCP four helix bundle domain-containing protein, partial [Desulfobulbaceae bacterium]|nr:MCP four helix bundle domain-containing protein [Desulfobulbaceae bacterium]